MKVQIKYKQLLHATPLLRRLYNEPLPIKTSYDIYNLIQYINPFLAHFDSEHKKMPMGTDSDIELEKLLEQDIEVEKVHIRLQDGVKISPYELECLLVFTDIEVDHNA